MVWLYSTSISGGTSDFQPLSFVLAMILETQSSQIMEFNNNSQTAFPLPSSFTYFCTSAISNFLPGRFLSCKDNMNSATNVFLSASPKDTSSLSVVLQGKNAPRLQSGF